MAVGPDPFRTLGLNPGASIEEIRRAYRRLAKANHPDAAGEAALPRFLAIQAAYESLVAPTRQSRPGARPREPWRADPERARATREGATRRPGRPPRGSPPGDGTTGGGLGGSPGGAAGGARRGGAGSGSTARTRPPEPGDARPGGGGARRDARRRAPNKATLGSTSYDEADEEPFEPEWSGGTWYGSSSGTYWTINPKEYADPRKHGPEYQRRARRPVDAADGAGESGEDDAAAPAGAAFETGPDRRFEPPARPAGATDEGADAAPTFVPPGAAPFGGFLGGFGGRVALALVGWPPIGLVLTSLAGEATGCTRFAATCVDAFGIGTWLAQLVIIAILLAVPSLAMISATGTIAALAAAVPTAVALSASGGSRQPEASAAVLGAILAIAYLVGVGVGTARRLGIRRVPWRQ